MLSEEARQARNRYMREWRAKNPDLVKKQNDLFWERRAVSKGQPLFSHIVNLHEQGLTVKEIAARLQKCELEINLVLQKYN